MSEVATHINESIFICSRESFIKSSVNRSDEWKSRKLITASYRLMYNVDRTTKNQRWKYNTLIWRIIVTFVFCLQASERCHGMALSSYMLKPVQRIPSYRLLLIGELNFLLLRVMIKFFFCLNILWWFLFPRLSQAFAEGLRGIKGHRR